MLYVYIGQSDGPSNARFRKWAVRHRKTP